MPARLRTLIYLSLLSLWWAACLPPAAVTTPRPATLTPTQATESSARTSPSATTPSPAPTTTLPPAPAHTAAPKKPARPDPTPTSILQPDQEITLLFTGVIVPARCVQAAIDARGDADYLYAEVYPLIQAADLAVGTLNATISAYPPHTGCVPTYTLVGGPENADALARAGFDLMSVATNHIKNCGVTGCGDRAFFDTLANLDRVGILAVGAGANHAAAMQPVVVTIQGIRFGFISLGQIEPTAFAGENSPGIAVLTPENLRSAIQAARKVADIVIAMPHWGPEDVPWPNHLQRELANKLVEAGADIVVGNHTHVVQAVQTIAGVPVFYGLGNFVFDQDLRDHRQGAALLLRFRDGAYAGYSLVPTHVDPDGTVHYADPAEAAEILTRVIRVSRELDPVYTTGYRPSLPAASLADQSPEEAIRQLFSDWLGFYEAEGQPPDQHLFGSEIHTIGFDPTWNQYIHEFRVETIAQVSYSVWPVSRQSFWYAGNGILDPKDGWIRQKLMFVGLRQEGLRTWLEILGTGF